MSHRLILSALFALLAMTLVTPVLAAEPTTAPVDTVPVTMRKTPDGVEYGLFGTIPTKPSPTLVILSGNIEDSFRKQNFLQAGKRLMSQGYLLVSIDLPNHGALAQKGFSGLVGWGKRAAAGDDFVAEFNGRLSKVLDQLIADKLTDPEKIVISGTSRGGFLAMRFMAYDKRVKAAVAFSPVTDLRKLKEFDVAAAVPAVDKMSIDAFVSDLVGRPLFITIGDRDDRVGTDSAIAFARKLSAAAVAANVPSQVEIHVLSEPRGHSSPAGTDDLSARWIFRTIEGRDLPKP